MFFSEEFTRTIKNYLIFVIQLQKYLWSLVAKKIKKAKFKFYLFCSYSNWHGWYCFKKRMLHHWIRWAVGSQADWENHGLWWESYRGIQIRHKRGYPQVNTVQIIGTSLRRGTFVYTQESISIGKTLIKQLYWMVDYCTFWEAV